MKKEGNIKARSTEAGLYIRAFEHVILIFVCESDVKGKKKIKKKTSFIFTFFFFQAHTFKVSVCIAGSHGRPLLHTLAVKQSVSQPVPAAAEPHCLTDKTWLT